MRLQLLWICESTTQMHRGAAHVHNCRFPSLWKSLASFCKSVNWSPRLYRGAASSAKELSTAGKVARRFRSLFKLYTCDGSHDCAMWLPRQVSAHKRTNLCLAEPTYASCVMLRLLAFWASLLNMHEVIFEHHEAIRARYLPSDAWYKPV